MTVKHILIIMFAVLVTVFIAVGSYNALTVRYYTVNTGSGTEGGNRRIRIALITDLHSCRYGKDQEKLLSAIDAQSPDIICMSGDIFDDRLPNDNTVKFIASVSGKYPCWYVTGNHEYRSGKDAFNEKMEILERYGVKRLSGECDTVTVNGRTINICGIDDREAYLILHEYDLGETAGRPAGMNTLKPVLRQLSDASSLADNGNYTILLSHRPEYWNYYKDNGFDLVLCGHAHGGQWRIPGLMNGLYAPNQGFFPKYAGGMYEFEEKDDRDTSAGHMTMIVSRGLARESTIIPRFYNRPEVVIIDLV